MFGYGVGLGRGWGMIRLGVFVRDVVEWGEMGIRKWGERGGREEKREKEIEMEREI